MSIVILYKEWRVSSRFWLPAQKHFRTFGTDWLISFGHDVWCMTETLNCIELLLAGFLQGKAGCRDDGAILAWSLVVAYFFLPC